MKIEKRTPSPAKQGPGMAQAILALRDNEQLRLTTAADGMNSTAMKSYFRRRHKMELEIRVEGTDVVIRKAK